MPSFGWLAALPRRESFPHRAGGPGEGDTPADGPRLDLDDLPEDDGDYGDGGLSWSIAETDRWGSGYCAEGVVSNDGVDAVEWSFQTAIEGEISSIWSAEAHDAGDEVLFTGPEWAPTIDPGGEAVFGFCASI